MNETEVRLYCRFYYTLHNLDHPGVCSVCVDYTVDLGHHRLGHLRLRTCLVSVVFQFVLWLCFDCVFN